MLFSASRALTEKIQEYGAEIHTGTPAYAQFPRWWRKGGRLWLESSSGSNLLTVDFDRQEIELPDWKVERDGLNKVQPMPQAWETLYLSCLFNEDGSAAYPEHFEAAMTRKEHHG